jgi:drug/metabolite transporter (DMT)-like permease
VSAQVKGHVVRENEKTAPVRRPGLVSWACLLIVYVVWGSTYLFIRIGVETMPPLLMAAARFLVAGIILFLLALYRPARLRAPAAGVFPLCCPARLRAPAAGVFPPRSSQAPRSSVQTPARPLARGGRVRWPSRKEWIGTGVAGVLLLVANGVVGVAERSVPSGMAALFIATMPLWLLGIDAGLNHARLGLAPLAGLLLGLAGVALLSGVGGSGHVPVAGALTILGAAAMWALGTIMARRGTLPSSPALASGMEMLIGGAALLVLSAVTGEFSSLHLGHVSARSWLALGYLIVIGSIVAFSAYGIAVRTLPTATVATYAYVNPVIAVLLGALILGENLTTMMITGGVLIVGAVVLVVRRTPPSH